MHIFSRQASFSAGNKQIDYDINDDRNSMKVDLTLLSVEVKSMAVVSDCS